MTTVKITCPIHPTEDPQKVKLAVENIFPGAEVQVTENELTASVSDLTHFSDRLRDQQIRDTARGVLLRGLKVFPGGSRQNKIKFWLNKQAAFMDRVNFTDSPSVLGDIRVVVECDDTEALIDELAPRKTGDERDAESRGRAEEPK